MGPGTHFSSGGRRGAPRPQTADILSVLEARLLSEALHGSLPLSPVLGLGEPRFPSNTRLNLSDKHVLKTGLSKTET